MMGMSAERVLELDARRVALEVATHGWPFDSQWGSQMLAWSEFDYLPSQFASPWVKLWATEFDHALELFENEKGGKQLGKVDIMSESTWYDSIEVYTHNGMGKCWTCGQRLAGWEERSELEEWLARHAHDDDDNGKAGQ